MSLKLCFSQCTFSSLFYIKARVERKKNEMLSEDRSTLTADALARWFQRFESKFSLYSINFFLIYIK
jgi:hypothetical protein